MQIFNGASFESLRELTGAIELELDLGGAARRDAKLEIES